MVNGKCWFIDNLALDFNSDLSGQPPWGTAPVYDLGYDPASSNDPQQTFRNNTLGQIQFPTKAAPRPVGSATGVQPCKTYQTTALP